MFRTSSSNITGDGEASQPDALRRAADLTMKSAVGTVVDYNQLETVFVFTAMLVLLAGMVFNSNAFGSGSVGYIVLTIAVCAIIIGTVLSFTLLIIFEVYRAIRFADVHAAARSLESASIEYRLRSAGSSGRKIGDGSGPIGGPVPRSPRRGTSIMKLTAAAPASGRRKTSTFTMSNPLTAAQHTRGKLAPVPPNAPPPNAPPPPPPGAMLADGKPPTATTRHIPAKLRERRAKFLG